VILCGDHLQPFNDLINLGLYQDKSLQLTNVGHHDVVHMKSAINSAKHVPTLDTHLASFTKQKVMSIVKKA
jgi:hypothetical protein